MAGATGTRAIASSTIRAPTSPQPRYLLLPNVVSSIATFGGLINAGVPTTSALYRRYFNSDGTLSPFVLGTGTATSAHSITNGGSGDDATLDQAVLAPKSQRASGFAYLDFDATPNLNLYVQGLWGQSMVDQPDHGGRFANVAGIDTRITIYRENAFLPAAVRQIMVNENLASFQMNVVGDRENLGRESHVQQDNRTQSGTIGFKYVFPKGFLEGWHVDGYAQYGTADNRGYQQGILLDRISAAVDAVTDPSGKVVCRAALQNPSKWSGCVPINLFGRGNASDAAIAYVTRFTPGQTITSPLFFQPDGYGSGQSVSFTSGLGKVYNTRTKQTVGEVSTNGKLFDGWAGPVAMAFGVSYRKEEIEQIVYDPSNPASDPNIFPAVDTALRGVPSYTATRSSMIQNSTVANVHGNYVVKEAFAELQMPLLADVPLVDRLNLLASARYADYTGSGGVWSWKTGLDWQVFKDLRLRGTISRDVRAATLLERFNQTGGVGTVTKDPVFPTMEPRPSRRARAATPISIRKRRRHIRWGWSTSRAGCRVSRHRSTIGKWISRAPSAHWATSASSTTVSPVPQPASARSSRAIRRPTVFAGPQHHAEYRRRRRPGFRCGVQLPAPGQSVRQWREPRAPRVLVADDRKLDDHRPHQRSNLLRLFRRL